MKIQQNKGLGHFNILWIGLISAFTGIGIFFGNMLYNFGVLLSLIISHFVSGLMFGFLYLLMEEHGNKKKL